MSHITYQYESYYKPTPNPSQREGLKGSPIRLISHISPIRLISGIVEKRILLLLISPISPIRLISPINPSSPLWGD